MRRLDRICGLALLCLLMFGWMSITWQMFASKHAKKHYWATSLGRTVDDGVLQGLQQAVDRGEVGWLDVDPKFPVPVVTGRVNLILYHVGGNCYIGRDCARFPQSAPTGDQWGNKERTLDLKDARTRKIVVDDLVGIVQIGDRLASPGAIVGVHIDNVHKLDADSLAALFNAYVLAVEAAKAQGLVTKSRATGYIAKNNPDAVWAALDQGLLIAAPLYQINENAVLDQDGQLDAASRVAQRIGRRYGIPVFLKTFGTDVAYAVTRDDGTTTIMVSPDMTRRMAARPNIAGAAWSPDEASYRPVLFEHGASVPPVLFRYRDRRLNANTRARTGLLNSTDRRLVL